MIKHRDQFKKLAKGESVDDQKFGHAVKHLLDVVIRNDFKDYHDHEELKSIGRLKIVEILNSGQMDLDVDPVPFLHRCVVQEIKNHLRDKARDESETHTVGNWQDVNEARTEPKPLEDDIDMELGMDSVSSDLVKHLEGIELFKEYYHK